MPIQLTAENNSKVLIVHVSGRLVKADYERFVPEFERLVRQHGKLRVLFDISDLHGWEVSAAWTDFKFGIEHFADIERLAMVGDKKWQAAITVFTKPFTQAQVRYYDHAQAADARTWLGEA